MIVFVLTYAVLALLVLSSVGSASAEIRKASVRVAHVSNCLNPGDFQVLDQQTRQIVV
jgi:cytochrome oxidase Cu insertion factor (SCO1/SenC/PrrC family)